MASEWVDPRVGKEDCACGHTSMQHHGESRTGSPIGHPWPGTGCKVCSWCDYYKLPPLRN